jgi:hypothetical protein
MVENIENSIMNATRRLQLGDVLLLELETQVRGYGASYWPIECTANLFPPIRLATANGITVVEAAGNSGCDLDDANTSPFRKNPNDPRNPPNTFDPNPNYNRDSGAIIVGAAVAISRGAARKGTRSLSSNYGSRVNCFAWGDTVYTLDIDINTGANRTTAGAGLTTPNFSGTSAAAAIVAGAAIVLQGICQRSRDQHGRPGRRLSGFEMRNKLSDPRMGTLSANPAADRIGVMPNLKRIINSF